MVRDARLAAHRPHRGGRASKLGWVGRLFVRGQTWSEDRILLFSSLLGRKKRDADPLSPHSNQPVLFLGERDYKRRVSRVGPLSERFERVQWGGKFLTVELGERLVVHLVH